MIDVLNIAFAHQSMWHRWSTISGFATALLELPDPSPEPTQLTQEQAQQVLNKLLAHPEVRAATSLAALFRARRKHPELADLLDRHVITGGRAVSGMNYALDTVREQTQARSETLQRQLPTLAQELADDAEFQDAASPNMRKTIAAQFLYAKAGGYTMPSALRDDLAARARRIQRGLT